MKYKSLLVSLAINSFLVLASAFADCPPGATCWTGNTDNNWFNPQNWSTNAVPDSSTDVQINYGKAIISTTGAAARS